MDQKGYTKYLKLKLIIHYYYAYVEPTPTIISTFSFHPFYIYIVFKTRLKSLIPLLLGETHVIFISFKNKYNIHPFRSSLVQYNSLLQFGSIMSNLVQFNWIQSILIHSVDFTLIYSGWVNTKSLFEIRLFC